MTDYSAGRHRVFFLIAAALFVTLGLFRMSDQRNDPYDGFLTDGNNTVIRVDAGGPAERAGLEVGDRTRRIDGVPVEDIRDRVELAGILLGILPVTIEVSLRILMPRFVLPGADFYYLTVGFVPIALVMAMMRQARAQEYVDGTLSHSS